jgi:hypothetical protein
MPEEKQNWKCSRHIFLSLLQAKLSIELELRVPLELRVQSLFVVPLEHQLLVRQEHPAQGQPELAGQFRNFRRSLRGLCLRSDLPVCRSTSPNQPSL